MTGLGLENAPSEWAWDNFDRDDAAGYERSDAEKDYEVLRDTIVAAFNPSDDDVAEVALMTDTLDRVWRFVVGLPCTCPADAADEANPCGRCDVLGRVDDVQAER